MREKSGRGERAGFVDRLARWLGGLAVLALAGGGPGASGAALVAYGDYLIAEQGVEQASSTVPDGAIIRVVAATGAQSVVTSGGFLRSPAGVAVGPDGFIYASDYTANDGSIIKIDPDTGGQTLLATGGNLVHPVGISFGPDGQLYVIQQGASQAAGALLRINRTSGAQTVVASGGFLKVSDRVQFDASGRALITDYQSGGDGAVIRIDLAGGPQVKVSSGNHFTSSHGPIGIAIETDGALIIGINGFAAGTSEVVRVDPATGAQSGLTSGGLLVRPDGLWLDPAGDVLVADQEAVGGNGAVIRVNHLTGAQTIFSSGNLFHNPSDITFFPEPGATAMLTGAMAMLMAGRRRRVIVAGRGVGGWV